MFIYVDVDEHSICISKYPQNTKLFFTVFARSPLSAGGGGGRTGSGSAILS